MRNANSFDWEASAEVDGMIYDGIKQEIDDYNEVEQQLNNNYYGENEQGGVSEEGHGGGEILYGQPSVPVETGDRAVEGTGQAVAYGDVQDEGASEEVGGATEESINKGNEASGLFQYFQGSLSDLIEKAKRTAGALIKKVVAPVSDRIKNDLSLQGVEIDEGYKHVIDNNAIRHALKNHGGQKEKLRGQIPITDSDFEKIPDIVENYDTVTVESSKRNDVNIIYSKTYDDGVTLFVEEKRNKRKELAAVTMRKKRNFTVSDANRNETTPISDSSEISDSKDSAVNPDSQAKSEETPTGNSKYSDKAYDEWTRQIVYENRG